MIYLDHNATTPLRRVVREAMVRYLGEYRGNPSSAHAPGRLARAAVELARRQVATAIGAEPGEITFTSGGTESNNMALFGFAAAGPSLHLIVSPIEHPSVIEPVREMERRGARVTWLRVDSVGRVSAEEVEAAIHPETCLVSVGWANNEVGTIQPIRRIAAICRARGILVHSDAVQAFGRLPIDVDGIDLCSISAHKIGGPTGVGALFVRRGVRLTPLLLGGGQERGVRPGTENVSAIVGFGASAASLAECGLGGPARRELLWRRIAPLGGVRRNSPSEGCLDNTLNVSVDGMHGEAIVAALDLEGVAVSLGSACAVGSGEPSHVLQALGRSDREARDGVRYSLGAETTDDEIEAAAAALASVVARIRRLRDGVPALAASG